MGKTSATSDMGLVAFLWLQDVRHIAMDMSADGLVQWIFEDTKEFRDSALDYRNNGQAGALEYQRAYGRARTAMNEFREEHQRPERR